MNRISQQWKPVGVYHVMYMGIVVEKRYEFLTRDIQDFDGWDINGETAGYWRVYPSFVEFQREYPRMKFYNAGDCWYVDAGMCRSEDYE